MIFCISLQSLNSVQLTGSVNLVLTNLNTYFYPLAKTTDVRRDRYIRDARKPSVKYSLQIECIIECYIWNQINFISNNSYFKKIYMFFIVCKREIMFNAI